MRKSLHLFLFATTAFLLVGCGADAQDNARAPALSELSGGIYPDTGISTHKSAQVFANQTDFSEAFARYTTDPAPDVDFTTHRVLLVDMGQRESGGYAVRVSGVKATGEAVQAEVTYSQPAPNCVVTDANTNPYQVVMLETTKDVLVKERLVTQVCQ